MHNQKTNQALLALGNRQDARHIRQAIEFSMPMRMTFAELMAQYTPSAGLAGMHAWCTDYPSVGGFGAEVVCTGSRWRSISQQHCLLSLPSAVAGTLFAAGSAAALYGSTVLIPGGVLEPDDNIRFMAIAQHPTIGTGSRSIGLHNAASSEGVIAGSAVSRFAHAVNSANQITVEKVSTLLSNTVARSTTSGQPVSAIAGSAAQLSETITSIASDHHIGIVVTPSADTSWLLYAASVYVEFAR